MEEQQVPGESVEPTGAGEPTESKQGRRGMPRGAKYAIGIGIVIALAAGAAFYLGVQQGIPALRNLIAGHFMESRPPEDSARHYPSNTIVYAWTTPAPNGRQLEDARENWRTLRQIPEFETVQQDVLQELEEWLGVQPEDIKSWLGADVSAGILDYDHEQQRPDWAATASVRNEGEARKFIQKLTAHLAEQEGAQFLKETRGDFELHTSEGLGLALALSQDLMVAASSPSALDIMLETSQGDPGQSLKATPAFQEAQSSMAERRAASIYLNVHMALRASGQDGMEQQPYPRWVMATAAISGDAITAEAAAPVPGPTSLEINALNSPMGALPPHTAVLVSASFDPDLDHWREELSDFTIPPELTGDGPGMGRLGPTPQQGDATFSDAIDLIAEVVQDSTGIDLEADLLDHLAGELTVAGWWPTPGRAREENDENAGSIVIMLSHRDDGLDDLRQTMTKLEQTLEEFAGIAFRDAQVGGNLTARVVGGELPYNPGYMFNQGYLILASGRDELAGTAARQAGQEPGLDSTPEIRRHQELLPGETQFLAFIDIPQASRKIQEHVPEGQQAISTLIQQTAGTLTVSKLTVAAGQPVRPRG